MNWLVFSYSLPSGSTSSDRVSIWRRLNRYGAITPKTGICILPNRDECLEAFQWLSQEVQEAKGESLLMRVEKFEGLEDNKLIGLFQSARDKNYEKIGAQIKELEQAFQKNNQRSKKERYYSERLKKIRNQLLEISGIDYFSSPQGKLVANRLDQFEKRLKPNKSQPQLPACQIEEFKGKTWVTRPKPHVDRLACIWLIRRFIDPHAKIKYANTFEKDEISFDMKDAKFGHHQDYCSFETMIRALGLKHVGLDRLGEIVHEIDLRDGQYNHPETAGVAGILKGWLLAGLSDQELESNGVQLFEALCTVLKREAENLKTPNKKVRK